MNLKGRAILILALMALLVSVAVAQDEGMMKKEGMKQGEGMIEEGQMPEMGPPKELQEVASMVGDWHYAGQFKMSPEADWVSHEADASFKFVCDGAALQMDMTGMMMGMEYHGMGLNTYDRETKMWQETWLDNVGARLSMYTGTFADGKMVMSGEDLMNGQKMHTRTTTYDITDKEFKWMMENSMDGENWFISMRGVYTRK